MVVDGGALFIRSVAKAHPTRPVKASFDPVGFVKQHGVVLAAAKGPVPNIAEAVAGAPIRGSWWGHAKGSQIFHALSAIDDCPDILCFRLVQGKITFVHRRRWAALVRLADGIGKERLAAVQQEHTPTGAHRNVVTPFPDWVPADVKKTAAHLSEGEARAQLGPWLLPNAAPSGKMRR
jgi:hypothetical protein